MSALIDRVSLALGLAPWLFALFPALVIAEHAIYLRFTQPSVSDPATLGGSRPDLLRASYDKTRRSIERSFGARALFLRYGIPAFLIALVAFAALRLLFSQDGWPSSWGAESRAASGARVGAIGAYLSALLYLARRVVRHDLTSGGATQATIVLVLGPVLAGVVAYVLRPTNSEQQSVWAGQDALFLALGMAPRRFASAIVEAVRRLWFSDDATTAPPPTRIVPLTQVRGITPDIEERLGEEGVYDVVTLAMADPITLYRNTAFDLRQILCWMDEGLLMYFAPKEWSSLEDAGISGAIDLAWYAEGTRQPELLQLATAAKVDPAALRDLAARLSEDAQVAVVWVLYQTGSADDQQAVPKPQE